MGLRAGAALVGLAVVAAISGAASARPDDVSTGGIVFLRNDRVYFMNADGSAQRRANLPGYPVWSPAGRHMAFFTDDAPGRGLYVANGDGTRRRRIVRTTQFDTCVDPVWSPDGRRIAYQTECEVDFMSIFVVNRVGTASRRLIRGTWHLGPRWSPDGRRILFVSNPEPHQRGWFLFDVDPDGRRLRRIRNSSLNPGPNADWRWSRDGKRIFFLTHEKVRQAFRPATRRQPPPQART